MKSTWSETLPTIGLGLLTIVVVIGAKQLLWGPSAQSTVHAVTSTAQPHDDNIERRLERIEKTVEDLRVDVAALRKRSDAPSTNLLRDTEPTRLPGEPPAGDVDPDNHGNPLNRGLDYIARGTYDDTRHGQILIDLAAAYAIPGLAPEMNNALRTTIQQVNDIGTEHIIVQARSLPRPKAVEELKVFLAMTPKLTAQQKARVNAVITAYQRTSAVH